jgi:hypothetical protein
MAARGMATVTRVAGNEEGDGEDARGGGMMVAMGHGLCVSFCLESQGIYDAYLQWIFSRPKVQIRT